MSDDPLNIDAVKVLNPDQAGPAPQAAPPSPGAGDVGRSAGDVVFLSDRRPRSHAAIQRQKEEYAGAAGQIRERDRALERLGQKVGALKEPLQAILKQYPPFGPEDKEREKFLRQFNGLRKELDAVTFPRPHAGTPQGETLPPPLSPRVSDGQINDHLKDLDVTSAALEQQRDELASEAALFAPGRAFSPPFSTHLGGVSPLSAIASQETAALQKSVEVGQQFAMNSGQGVSASNPQFLKSLG